MGSARLGPHNLLDLYRPSVTTGSRDAGATYFYIDWAWQTKSNLLLVPWHVVALSGHWCRLHLRPELLAAG